MASQQAQNNPTKYFVFSKTDGTILSNYPNDPGILFDEAIGVSSFNYSVTETTTDFPTGQLDEDGNPITQAIVTGITYSPVKSILADFKKAAVVEISARPLEVSEVTLANGLVFDDTRESVSYLSDKLSTASEHIYVYDKYNSVQEMSGPQIQTAISLLTSSKLDKDDALRAIISSVNAANTINAAAIAAGYISGGSSSSSSSK